jgi:hypothetical protein
VDAVTLGATARQEEEAEETRFKSNQVEQVARTASLARSTHERGQERARGRERRGERDQGKRERRERHGEARRGERGTTTSTVIIVVSNHPLVRQETRTAEVGASKFTELFFHSHTSKLELTKGVFSSGMTRENTRNPYLFTVCKYIYVVNNFTRSHVDEGECVVSG